MHLYKRNFDLDFMDAPSIKGLFRCERSEHGLIYAINIFWERCKFISKKKDEQKI
jgi:hypothetical protein